MPPARLYLLRHADAAEAADDAVRPLSSKGRRQIDDLVGLLRPTDAFVPTEVWTSPLVRARETADRLLHQLRLEPRRLEHQELAPEADPAATARKIRQGTHSLALVGHEPHLGRLASLLVAGATDPVVFTFRKTTLLALEPAGSRWSVAWQVSPELTG